MDGSTARLVPGKKNRLGFTLIELLVVVAIIALLIAILLPSLGRARENARIVVCGTHMKQIATANLMYIDQNRGFMITAGIAATGVTMPPGQTAYAQFWANDLASQGYLPTKNNVAPNNGTVSVPSTSSIFYCPDGTLTENVVNPNGGNVTSTGNCPRDPINTWYVKLISATPAIGDTAAFTWYTLNCHNMSAQSKFGGQGGTAGGGGGAAAFVQWNKDGTSGETLAAAGGYTRKISMIQAAQKFVMVLESSSISWDANGGSATPPTNPPLAPTSGHPQRLAGRHGDTLNGGYDGYTNFAYFDGHVTKQSTVPYSNNPVSTYSKASPDGGFTLPPVVSDTIFYFNSQ